MTSLAAMCSHHPPLLRTGSSTVMTVATRTVPRVSTAVRLPADLHTELQQQATEREVSVNFLVTRAVLHYLKALRPADPLNDTEGADT